MSDEQVEVADEAASTTPEALTLLLEDARSKADEHWNQVLRMQAELENQRKRAARDLESAHKYALDRFIADLLPVKDSLELGLAAAGDGNDSTVVKLREGMELTLKMLAQVLEKFGVREINPLGEPFNPEFHQAMTLQPAAHAAPNTVLNVFQKGYTLNERLVRPAMVVVSAADESSGNNAHVDVRA
ncbi:MAG: nucleotide exchange factor GrpE [Gammaproteobacteria bacterium]